MEVLTGTIQSTPARLTGSVTPIAKGDKGDSAYDVACQEGFYGTCDEWLASLKGEKGEKGDDGLDADSMIEPITNEQINELMRGMMKL